MRIRSSSSDDHRPDRFRTSVSGSLNNVNAADVLTGSAGYS